MIQRYATTLAAALFAATSIPAQLTITSAGPVSLSTGTLRISGTMGADSASVYRSGRYVIGKIGTTSRTYLSSAVLRIVFSGGSGDDRFVNSTNIPATIYGSSGADYLVGGSGADVIHGGDGNDRIYGGSGDDRIYGGNGEDVIYAGDGDDIVLGEQHDDWIDAGPGRDRVLGCDGADYLRGGDGDDELFGGPGQDTVLGDAGDDVLVTIGGAYDRLWGGSGNDNLWMDSTDGAMDASATEWAGGFVHRVASFHTVRSALLPTSFTPSKELLGQNLLDPAPRADDGAPMLRSFRANPLFASAGPSTLDAKQGAVGDCYMIASLAALAEAKPVYLRKLVADLGDGTFAVRFMDAGGEHYVRVDADLYVDGMGAPLYAGLGRENCLWVAIVEKAYAFFRYDQGTYDAIAGGKESFYQHFDLQLVPQAIAEVVAPQVVVYWANAGSPEGSIKDDIVYATRAFLNQVDAQRKSGVPVITAAVASLSDSTQLVYAPGQKTNTWRRGQHVQMITRVLRDASNNAIGVELYNPYGSFRTITDLSRLYFCLTRAVAMPPKR